MPTRLRKTRKLRGGRHMGWGQVAQHRASGHKGGLGRSGHMKHLWSTVIKEAINSLLDEGITDKQDIYSKVVDNLGVPRPTVRRVARDLRNELLTKIKILQSETQQTTVPTV